jgi:hypothetical protein
MKNRTLVAFLGVLLFTVVGAAWAQPSGDETGSDTADRPDLAAVIDARARETSPGTWSFDVTVLHNDEGWDHYADAWEVRDAASGEIYGTRELLHPHVTEMPFTRSLGGVAIPADVAAVRIRARCTVHGYGGEELVLELSR